MKRHAALAVTLLVVGSAGVVVHAQGQWTSNAWPLPEIGLPLPHIGLPPPQPVTPQQPVTVPPGQLPPGGYGGPVGRPLYPGVAPFPTVVYVMPYPVIAMPVPVPVAPSVGAPSRHRDSESSTRRHDADTEAAPPVQAPPPAAPAPVAAPAPPSTVYVIPGCYAGNVPPSKIVLPAGCDADKVRTLENR